MKIEVKRTAKKETYTIGKMFIDGVYFCDTLEHTERENGIKIYGQTAIPKGKYKVIITWSNRFKRPLPLLLNVPNFEAIRIHCGNTADDTHGCILVGENKEVGKVLNSKKNEKDLMQKINSAIAKNEEITIEIT